MTYTRSPMNYMGGKFKLLPQILPLFPADVKVFVDLFTGGLDVALNVKAESHVCVDLNAPMIALYQALNDRTEKETVDQIDARIKEFDLSKTNTEGYRTLREAYNASGDPLDLFVLIAHSFNHQVRFNSNLKFNTPFGKDRSSYNPMMKSNLSKMIRTIQAGDYQFTSSDFRAAPLSDLSHQDFLYCDPPYLISSGTYNDGKRGYGGWSPADDKALMLLLDRLDRRDVPWAMSNVTSHKGEQNAALLKWSNRYQVHSLDFNYDNSNYQSAAKSKPTSEVLITNYTPPARP